MSQYDFERFFDLSLDMLCIAGVNGYFKHVNESFQRTLGWTVEELTARPFVDFVHPDDVAATVEEVTKLAAGGQTIFFKNRYRCSNGSYRHLLWTAVLESEGVIFAIARDTTELIDASERFQLAIDASPTALLMVDRHGFIQLVNRETERLFGYSREDLIGAAIEVLVPADGHVQHRQDRAEFFQRPSRRSMGTGRQIQAVRRDGVKFPAEIGLNPIRLGEEVFVLSTVVDLTLQKQAEERMTRLAAELENSNARLAQLVMTDGLTKIANRTAFDEQLDGQLQLMFRVGRPLSLVMLDIDYFKQFNDRYGHPAGDEALKKVAGLLRKTARVTDVVARYGGEEFGVVLPNTDEEGAMQMAGRFQAAIHAHPWGQDKLTVSMGVATLLADETTGTQRIKDKKELVGDADRALYVSKNNGRDRVTHVSETRSADQAT